MRLNINLRTPLAVLLLVASVVGFGALAEANQNASIVPGKLTPIGVIQEGHGEGYAHVFKARQRSEVADALLPSSKEMRGGCSPLAQQIVIRLNLPQTEGCRAVSEFVRSNPEIVVESCTPGLVRRLTMGRTDEAGKAYAFDFRRSICRAGEMAYSYRGIYFLLDVCLNVVADQEPPQAPVVATPPPPAPMVANVTWFEIRTMYLRSGSVPSNLASVCNKGDSRGRAYEQKKALEAGQVQHYTSEEKVKMTLFDLEASPGTKIPALIHGRPTTLVVAENGSATYLVSERRGDSGLSIPRGVVNDRTYLEAPAENPDKILFDYPNKSCHKFMHTAPGELKAAIDAGLKWGVFGYLVADDQK